MTAYTYTSAPAGTTGLVFAAALLATLSLPPLSNLLRIHGRRLVLPMPARHCASPLAARRSHHDANIANTKVRRLSLSHATRQLLYTDQLVQRQTVKMAPSNLPAIFNPTQQDIEMLLAAQCHLGSKNLQVHMEPYLWKTRPDGVNVLNIGKTWEKIVLAARIIVAIDNPADSTFTRAVQDV